MTTGPTAAAPPERVAARELERELKAQGGLRWVRRLGVLLLLGGAVAGLVVWRQSKQPPPASRYTTEVAETREIREEFQSTGTVKPLTEVQVGAQVSGRVVKVHVDFNAQVKAGDLLAEIDPSILGAQVQQSGAQLRAAQAALKRAQANLRTLTTQLARMQKLQAEGLASEVEVEQLRGQRDVAQADVGSARAQIAQVQAGLGSARTTLAYTRIYSPIDGVVISRAVEPGQTVAASFNTPTLFVIAQDLAKMQVLAEIDEADIGRVAEGMRSDVVVDAFPGQRFEGKVSQLRFSPNVVQGVVTYSAVIDVANPELRLRPGMTATVTIRAREAKGVLAVRNAALRFRPLPEKDAEGKPIPVKPAEPLPAGKGRVMVLAGAPPAVETVTERVIDLGLSDGVWTEVKAGDVQAGLPLVVEQREEKKGKRFGIF